MSLEKEFLAELIDAITHDRLTLPTLPEVALKIREAVNDPEVTSSALASVIGQDVALAARIIKVANSPLIRGTVIVDNLQLAISHVLASNFTKLQPDQATLAGLIHEIGILPILTLAEENPAILTHEAMLDKIIARLHAKVGRAILKAWGFPDELLGIPTGCIDFKRDGGPNADYIDVVTVAKLQAYSEDKNPYADLDTSTVPAFQKLGLASETEVVLVDELAVEVEETKQALF